jgi:hypothetical protein
MKSIGSKIKPAAGFAHFFHIGLNAFLPLLVYVLVRIEFAQLALVVILLSKWRMLSVRPRYWWSNILANGVDIIVGVSILGFMTQTASVNWQLFWVLTYVVWLVLVKPASGTLIVSLQAMTAQLMGLMALFLLWPAADVVWLMIGTWAITYSSARHFLTSFEEDHVSLLSNLWAYFSASLVFILGKWLLYYGIVPQPVLILTVVGYGFAALYYLEHHERLSALVRRQFIFIMVAILVVVIAFSSWSDKAL